MERVAPNANANRNGNSMRSTSNGNTRKPAGGAGHATYNTHRANAGTRRTNAGAGAGANAGNNARRNKTIRNREIRGGIGGYGIVLSPAVNNIVNGEVRAFPENVTKLFFKKNAYNKALRNINTIKRKVPVLAYNIHGYTRNFKLGNIKNKEIYNTIKSTLTGADNETSLYGVHMIDMGYDLFDMYHNETLQVQLLKNVKFVRNIIQEMRNALLTVKALNESGYIHGDIRDTNVLCNIKTGKLQIIDFDFLQKITNFDRAPVIRTTYTYPVIGLIIANTDNILNEIIRISKTNADHTSIKDSFDEIARKHINTHYKEIFTIIKHTYNLPPKSYKHTNYALNDDEYAEIFVNNYTMNIVNIIDGLRKSITPDSELKENDIRGVINETLLHSYRNIIDIYGLGIAFIYYIHGLFKKIKIGSTYDTLQMLNYTVMKMIAPLDHPLTNPIDGIISNFNELLGI